VLFEEHTAFEEYGWLTWKFPEEISTTVLPLMATPFFIHFRVGSVGSSFTEQLRVTLPPSITFVKMGLDENSETKLLVLFIGRYHNR